MQVYSQLAEHEQHNTRKSVGEDAAHPHVLPSCASWATMLRVSCDSGKLAAMQLWQYHVDATRNVTMLRLASCPSLCASIGPDRAMREPFLPLAQLNRCPVGDGPRGGEGKLFRTPRSSIRWNGGAKVWQTLSLWELQQHGELSHLLGTHSLWSGAPGIDMLRPNARVFWPGPVVDTAPQQTERGFASDTSKDGGAPYHSASVPITGESEASGSAEDEEEQGTRQSVAIMVDEAEGYSQSSVLPLMSSPKHAGRRLGADTHPTDPMTAAWRQTRNAQLKRKAKSVGHGRDGLLLLARSPGITKQPRKAPAAFGSKQWRWRQQNADLVQLWKPCTSEYDVGDKKKADCETYAPRD